MIRRPNLTILICIACATPAWADLVFPGETFLSDSNGPATQLIDHGETIKGSGVISTNVVNHGNAIGFGTGIGERLVFDASSTVSGSGYFKNTLVLGTFAPENSPGVTNGTDQAFGGTLEFELGGTTPGFDHNNHDQINDDATIAFFGSPTLSISPWNSFVPTVGDQFVVMTWQAGFSGNLGSVDVDPFFVANDISFATTFNNINGAGNLTLTAIPEPSAFLAVGLFGVLSAYPRTRRPPPLTAR